MSVQHEEMESKFKSEIEDLIPKEEELKVGNGKYLLQRCTKAVQGYAYSGYPSTAQAEALL